jgi:hypothetical protein
VVVVVLAALAVAATARPKGEGKPGGLFAPLTKGRAVLLKERGGAYEIGIGPAVVPEHKVVEVGADYVVVEEIGGLKQLRIPIYAVRVVRVSLVGAGR